MDRTILHCDLNGFYASVELLSYPYYRDKPVAVCGNPENRHGIILAKNEAAKKYNVKTAETIWQAKKKCPNLILLPPHHDLYEQYSKAVNQIYLRYTNLVEPFGIDESWLDVTNSRLLFGDGKTIADKIRNEVKSEFGLTVSVGVSFNKAFAKLGSDYKKPDATTVISRENFKKIVFPLPASDLLYVGKSSLEKLNSIGIKTIGDIAACDKLVLERLLGKNGVVLHDYASGNDNSPVMDYSETDEIKSVGNGTTFSHDLTETDEVKEGIMLLCENVSARLIGHKLKAGCVQIAVKYNDFKVISRQAQTEIPIFSDADIFKAAMEIFEKENMLKKPIRMITVTASALTDIDEEIQLSILDSVNEGHRKKEALAKAKYMLNQKYGKGSVSSGRTVNKTMEKH